MVTGRNILGDAPKSPLVVWYCNLEDPAVEIERRIAAACKHHKITAEQIDDRLFVDSGRDQPFVVVKQEAKETRIVEPMVSGIIQEIKRRNIDVLIVDPFVSTHEVNENDNGAIQRVAAQWVRVAEEGDCSVELIHHVRKSSDEITADDARGAGALKDKVRSMRVINAMTEAEAGRAGIGPLERFDYFRVDGGKTNMTRRGVPSNWRRFVSVYLDNGRGNLDLGDNVGVVEAWSWPTGDALVEEVTAEQLTCIKARVGGGDYRENAQANDWAGLIVAEVLGLESDDKAAKSRVTRMLKAWTDAGHFKVVIEHDHVTRKVKKFIRPQDAPPDDFK